MLKFFLSSALAEETAAATETAAEETEAVSTWLGMSQNIWIGIIAVIIVAVLIFASARTRKCWNAKSLAFAAVCLALATVLRYIKLFEMPQGGSVTLASMFPLMLFAAVYGVGPGMLVGAAYGFLRYMTGGWFVHPIQFLLDYPLAFALIGLTGVYAHISPAKADGINGAVNHFFEKLCRGIARLLSCAMPKPERGPWLDAYHPMLHANCCVALCMILGALGRAASATLAGVFFWDTAFWPSLVYNGTYLIPDTLICMIIAIPLAERLMKIMKKA